MIVDNKRIEKLIICIGLTLILLGICMSVDYATDYIDNDIITVPNQTIDNMNITNVTYLNGTHYALDNDTGVAKLHKIVVEKPKHSIIAMTGKPSCSRCARNHIPYKWFTKKYINYCPNCGHYNCLGNKHKRGSVHEQEITCFRCDSDFCVYCGKEKYSWSKVQLRKV